MDTTIASPPPEDSLPPAAEGLPELPAGWLHALRVVATGTAPPRARERGNSPSRAGVGLPAYDVTQAMTPGQPSAKVAQRLAKALYDLSLGVSRHDTTLRHVLALLRLGQSREAGVELALQILYREFVEAVGPDRQGGERTAETEFTRMVANAERLLADSDQPADVEADEAAQAEAAFWAQRPILSRIQRFAWLRRANPYAVTGAVLRRAIALVPPSVQFPPIIGHNASVNLFTASVGKSGQGKDIANGVGAAAVRFLDPGGNTLDDPPSPGIGSGEGLARVFRGHGNGDELAQTAANIEVNEIGTLASLAQRQGSTLVGEILKAFTGQAIGFTNAQRATTTHVAAHTYRLCMGISAQPENVGFFLDREKDGLPQRFLWLPIVNPYARPPGGEPPEDVPPAEVVIPVFPTIIAGTPYLIGVPASVRSEIEQFRYLVEIGSDKVDPLDSHLKLLQLKVAFGLAVLDERRDITDDDWRIAGQLMEVSNRVRAEMAKVVRERSRRENSARAHALADRQMIIDDRLSEDRQQRVSGAIQRKLQRVGSATRRELLKTCTKAIREDFGPVFETLLDSGVIVPLGGDQYGLASG